MPPRVRTIQWRIGQWSVLISASFTRYAATVSGAACVLTALGRLAGASPAWLLAGCSGGIIAVEIATHETAHALTALALGGLPVRIALIGRPLVVGDYGRLTRRERVAVALAGTGVSFAFLVGGVIWVLTANDVGTLLALFPALSSTLVAVAVGLASPAGDLQLALMVDRGAPPLHPRRTRGQDPTEDHHDG